MALGLVSAACGSARIRDGVYLDRAKRFAVALPADGWRVETDQGPGLLLRHASGEAGMLVQATCGAIPPGRTVEITGRHLLFGIERKETLRRERRAGAWGDELEVLVRGGLDGRDLLLHGYTLKGDGCVYDLVLFAAPAAYARADPEFETLVHGFRLLGDDPQGARRPFGGRGEPEMAVRSRRPSDGRGEPER